MPISLALEICPIQTGARLTNDPDARPKSALKMYRPGSECPKGSQMAKMAVAPTAISAVCVFSRPKWSAIAPAKKRPKQEPLQRLSQQK